MLFNKVQYPFLGEGNPKAEILIVTEYPNAEESKSLKPIGKYKKEIFSRTAKSVGFKESDFFFVSCTNETLPIEISSSEAKKRDHVIKHREKLIAFLKEFKPKIIIPLGKSAATALAGKSVKLNTVRGMIQDYELPAKVFPTKSIGEILRSPEQEQVLEIDLRAVKELKESNYNLDSIVSRFDGTDYRYVTDLQELIDLKPKVIAIDTETTGLLWYRPEIRAITIQAAYAKGKAVCTIVNPAYDSSINFDLQRKLISQWKEILENPEIKKVAHNLKYDHHILSKLGINVKGWVADTAMLAFAVDENQESFRQSDCVKRYVPEMAGYSDVFDTLYDKAKMIEVPKEEMLKYACGDTDTCLRLFNNLLPILKKDKKQFNLFTKVQMPALKAFIRMEQTGVAINTTALKELELTLRAKEKELYESILSRVSGELKRKYLDNLSLGRPAFLRDILFSDLGLKLKPVKFTKTTAKLKNEKDKLPSISAKQHLTYFMSNPLVADIVEHVKTTKIISTYIGDSQKDTGFYKWIYKGLVHPNFYLWGTVTGRTSCVHKDTIINTNNGKKKIIDITPNDKVLSHKNNWKKVEHLIIKPDQDMYNILFSNGEVLTCTEEHKLLTNEGEWVTLRDVYFKETFKRSEYKKESNKSLRELIINNESSIKRIKSKLSHSLSGHKARFSPRKNNKTKIPKIFGIKKRLKKSYEREEATELQRRMFRSQRVFNSSSRWETLFRSQGSNGRPLKNTCEGFTELSNSSSYRRKPTKQPHKQFSFSDEYRAYRNPRKIQKNKSGIKIERVEFSGVYPVYDITVTDDHSYECCGVFNHNSREPNGQNIPKHGPIAKSYRKIFEPREGYTLLEVDLSQAELRYAAWMANDKEMLKVYKEGGDIHEATAAAVMGLTIEQFRALEEEVIEKKRQEAKGVNFGLVYTMTPESLVDYVKANYGVDMTLAEARKAHKAYFKKYKNLLTWHEFMIATAVKLGYVRSLHGAKRNVPAIHSRDYSSSSEAKRRAINSPIQRLASDSVLFALIRMNREVDHRLVRPILFIHDALALEVKTELVIQLSSAVKWYMETPPFKEWFNLDCPVPIVSDAAIGNNLSDLKKLAKIKEADFKYKGLENYFVKENGMYKLAAVKPDWKHLSSLID